MNLREMTVEEIYQIHWSAAQEIDRRGGRMDSYAAPHVWNITAKVLREEFPIGNNTGKKLQRAVVAHIALRFARRFAEDSGFDAVAWLDKCSPDPDAYPLSELWEEDELD